ncbi:hypothetical protein Glove_21g313 [Diversispora epigaea]|uniref:Galactose oxidase n=1 Tax=Diversispora epigaea TaxID=1348612 RepID=A0A397JW81_9GLOM|nr:hypothetical protein Glove_21g313 [Diversispora epigaea]
MKIKKLNIEYFIYFLIISQSWIISIYSFKSPQILAHSTALIDKKLYFIGGFNSETDDRTPFFYLDLNQSFNISSPAYVYLEGPPVKIAWATACVGGENNATIFVFGGLSWYDNSTSYIKDKLINTFDTASLEWSTPQIEGEPLRRRDLQAVIDTKGNMYMFGGAYSFYNNTESIRVFNITFNYPNYSFQTFKDMVIFNTITFKYSNGSTINGPLGMTGYTATLLPNGIIIYIGGKAWSDTADTTIPIINITMYDINEDSWNSTTAKSPNDILDRSYHSAVLTSNGRIICYGGIAELYKAVSPSLIVLDTTSFEWSSKKEVGTNKPPMLYAHSANLVENYMIIGFGNITDGDPPTLSTSSNIYILDLRNYTWISYYEASEPSPSPLPSTLPSPTPGTNNILGHPKLPLSVGAIIGITIGVAIVLGLLLFFGIRFYRRASLSYTSRIKGIEF